MKQFFLLVIFFSFFKTNAQTYTAEILSNAKAYTNTFIPINCYGKMRNGHIYTCGLKNNYAQNGESRAIQFVLIDLTANKITYKELEGIPSSPSILWIHFFDSKGALYLSFIYHQRILVKFNLEDSISYENLGNPFKDNRSTIYSASLGKDNHIYLGGSSGDPYVSEYIPEQKKIIKYPSMDAANDFALSVTGDEKYIYAQTGQRNSIQLWAMKKQDSTKQMLFKIPNNTRMSLVQTGTGIFLSFHTDTLKGTWKLSNGAAIPFKENIGKFIAFDQQLPPVASNFDAVQKKLFYSINNSKENSILIASDDAVNKIRKVFGFKNDPDNIYYAGDYYGNYYSYNIKKNTSELLGNTAFNIYAALEDSDSTMYFGNYPSGALLKWNRNLPWTLNKFIGNKIVLADKNSNPHLIGYFKGETPAGFHHLLLMAKDFKGNIVCAGNVIRIGNTCSIGVYNVHEDKMYGYDFNAIKSLSSSGLAAWKNLMIFSTNNSNGGNAKLYFYNSITNKMTDSINLGFNDYGSIYIFENTLIGIANDRMYKLNLATKQLMQNFSFKKNSVSYSQLLANGTIIINTQNNLPADFWKIIKMPYSEYFESKSGLYALSGKSIISVKNISK